MIPQDTIDEMTGVVVPPSAMSATPGGMQLSPQQMASMNQDRINILLKELGANPADQPLQREVVAASKLPTDSAIVGGGGGGVPGTGMGGVNPILSGMEARRAKASERLDALETDYKASRAREELARTAQQAALAPVGQQIKDKLSNAPVLGETSPIPQAPQPIKIDTKEMGETLSLITALAALAGALTRTPLTSALNSFSAGVQGYVTGNQKVFDDNIKTFNAELQKAKAQNDIVYHKYQTAKEKFGTDIQGLQQEYKLIAAETQNPIDLELARRGDIVTLDKISQQRAQMDDKIDTARMKFMETVAQHQQKTADVAAQRAIAQDRLDEQIRHNKELEALSGRKADQTDTRDALKAAAAAQGGKPTATERQHYVESNQLINSVDRVRDMLAKPELRKKVDDSRLASLLSESIESKVIQQFLVRPNLDPEVKQYLNEILMLRNQYYLDQSGKAVTGGEALRNYGAVVQPGDTSDDVLNKMEIAATRARSKMKDYETYFPSLKVIRGDVAPAAGAFDAEKEKRYQEWKARQRGG